MTENKLTNITLTTYEAKNIDIIYKDQISQTLSGEFVIPPKLSWSKYCLLMQIKKAEARACYEQEAINNNWSVRELDRQIGSLLC